MGSYEVDFYIVIHNIEIDFYIVTRNYSFTFTQTYFVIIVMTHIEQYLVRNQYLIYQVSHTNYAVKKERIIIQNTSIISK